MAPDGESGVEAARSLAPDVALCDLGLPRIDGCEVARRVRAAFAGRGPRLVALSGYAAPEDVGQALRAGFRAAGTAARTASGVARHTASHFTYEEALMDDVAYPNAAAHRDQHAAFAAEFARLRDRIERDGATRVNQEALAGALERWIAEHVLGEDRRPAAFDRRGESAAA